MKLTRYYSVLACLLAFSLPQLAHAQYYGYQMPPEQAHGKHERPMPMMRNDVRLEHRRQGAKCMNAYPEDHGGFTSCIKNEREGSQFQGGRRQFMPMAVEPADY